MSEKKEVKASTITHTIFSNLRSASKESHVNVNRLAQRSDYEKAKQISLSITNAKQTHVIDVALRCSLKIDEIAQLLVETKKCANEKDALKRIKRHMSDTSSRISTRNAIINTANARIISVNKDESVIA